jgi:hypothetical protein
VPNCIPGQLPNCPDARRAAVVRERALNAGRPGRTLRCEDPTRSAFTCTPTLRTVLPGPVVTPDSTTGDWWALPPRPYVRNLDDTGFGYECIIETVIPVHDQSITAHVDANLLCRPTRRRRQIGWPEICLSMTTPHVPAQVIASAAMGRSAPCPAAGNGGRSVGQVWAATLPTRYSARFGA